MIFYIKQLRLNLLERLIRITIRKTIEMAARSITASERRKSQNRIAQRRFREKKAAQFNEIHEQLKEKDKKLLRLQEVVFQVQTITEDSTIALLCHEALIQVIESEASHPATRDCTDRIWSNSLDCDTNTERGTMVGASKVGSQTIGTIEAPSIDNSLAIQPFTGNWSNPFSNSFPELPTYGNDFDYYFNQSHVDLNSQIVCYEPQGKLLTAVLSNVVDFDFSQLPSQHKEISWPVPATARLGMMRSVTGAAHHRF